MVTPDASDASEFDIPCPLCGGPTRFVLDVDPEGEDPRPEVSGWARLFYCQACVQLWALTPVSTIQVDSRHARALAREVLRLQAQFAGLGPQNPSAPG
jgi:hypothetical protein